MAELDEADDHARTSWMTPYKRALLDFEVINRPDRHGVYFRNPQAVADLTVEQKRLGDRSTTLYALTFLGSCIVLAGGLPSESQIGVLGFEAPASVLSQHLLAALVSGLFSLYITTLLSHHLAGSMLEKILVAEGHESWEFFVARQDASRIWAILLKPKQRGYQSPKREFAITLLIGLTAIATLVMHALVVWSAAVSSLVLALSREDLLPILLSGVSVAIVGVSIVGYVAVLSLQVPYRFEEETYLRMKADGVWLAD